jgi:hypothetical protein
MTPLEEAAKALREHHREEGRKARRCGFSIADCPYTPAAPPDPEWGVQAAVEWLKGWHEEPPYVVTPLPISDNPHAGDFAKAILEQMAAQFGLTFEQLQGRVVGRVNHYRIPADFDDYIHPGVRKFYEHQRRAATWALEAYRRNYERICAIYFLGYDPQRLLEDRRGKADL